MTTISFQCEKCEKVIDILDTVEEIEGATIDCPTCKTLLVILILDGKILTRDFHKWMNERDPIWPKDGKNTGMIEI